MYKCDLLVCSLLYKASCVSHFSFFSLRARFAVEDQPINQLHGSSNHKEAEQELSFFFPKQQTLAVIKPDAMEEHRGSAWLITTLYMLKCTLVISLLMYRPHPDREDFGGDPRQRFFHNAAEGNSAVDGGG